MPSATKPRDASVAWPVHTCGVRHHPKASACPRVGEWLVATSDPGKETVIRPLRVVR